MPHHLFCCGSVPAYLLLLLLSSCFCGGHASNITTIKIGALVAFNSTIGKDAKQAIELAVRDVNNDSKLLSAYHLELRLFDTNCSAFQGAAAAMDLLKEDVVAIVGPQSSTVSHFIAHMGSATQIPLVSFGATDPALSESQYPFFFRVTHNDAGQMEAVAALIKEFGWREVIALYSDDDYGTSGIAALSGSLEMLRTRITEKVALVPGDDNITIGHILAKLKLTESRIFVVHMQQDMGLQVLSEANYLGMMTTGFVWIATDLTIASLDLMYKGAAFEMPNQGIIGTRRYVPESLQLRIFLSEWKKLKEHKIYTNEVNVYALYAYDAVWTISYAIDSYIREGGGFIFERPTILPSDAGHEELTQLKKFKGGLQLREKILETRFNGTTGHIQLNEKGDLVRSAFELVNMVGKSLHTVGYWTSGVDISISPPDSGQTLHRSSMKEKLFSQNSHIIWPGGNIEIPRGWVFPQNGSPLLIGVPRKAGYRDILSETADANNITLFHGFCINVFEAAVKYLPYAVLYRFVPYGNGTSTPDYNDLIQQLAEKVFDGVVGDVTITMKRSKLVDFTQPYAQSGLVVLVPRISKQPHKLWAFLWPFTLSLWLTIGAFLIFTALVIWMLEHKINQDFQGHPKKQIGTVLWFIFSTLFVSHRENTRTVLGRAVLLIWLLVVFIVKSSYTANLTSILTVKQLSPTIQSIDSLLKSDVPIGYQTGSFVREYLIALNVKSERLRPLSSKFMYAKALNLGPDHGGVAAVIDERAYTQLFLAKYCDYTIAGQEFTKSGWGFAFPKDSQLAIDMSQAIVTMSGNGELQQITDLWFNGQGCSSTSSQVQHSELDVNRFGGLFLVTGFTSFICIILYSIRLFIQFNRSSETSTVDSSPQRMSSISRFVFYFKRFASFTDMEHPLVTSKRKRKRKEQADAV